MKNLNIEGHNCIGNEIKTTNVSILTISAKRGMLGCGYISLDAANKFDDALAIVTGVKDFDDMLAKPVVATSQAAEILGVRPGMSGKDAIIILSK